MRGVAVGSGSADCTQRAVLLATRLQLPLLRDAAAALESGCAFFLEYRQGILHLQSLDEGQSICVDFESASALWRQRQGPMGEMVVKAMGGKKSVGLCVFDATAGLGQDSFILASAGMHVHMNEGSVIVHALLQDALERISRSSDTTLAAVSSRLHLTLGDSREILVQMSAAQPGAVDIVYLDPMFPERRKSAKVKKNMQVLQQLLGHDTESDSLLQLALACARRRVVVKRPRHAGWLDDRKPALEVPGKSSRFDIYLCG